MIAQTVRGAVNPEELGFTLPHEHLLIDLVGSFGTQLLAFDFRLLDHGVAIAEARRFKALGGGCIVDVTLPGIGRDHLGLRAIADALDLHVIMGCGWYRDSWFGPEVDKTSTTGLARLLIEEIRDGVQGSGIKPGVIGELGADLHYLTAREERVLRAGAIAHHATNLPITLHSRMGMVAFQQLEVLEDEGVDLRRVIVGHADVTPDPDYHEALASRGAWVEFDTIRGVHRDVVESRLALVGESVSRGFSDRVLLSHDVCALSHLRMRGGTGYDYLLGEFVDELTRHGVPHDLISQMTTANPQKALSFEA